MWVWRGRFKIQVDTRGLSPGESFLGGKLRIIPAPMLVCVIKREGTRGQGREGQGREGRFEK